MTCLTFKFFDRTVIERVLDIYMSEGDVAWAERMWQQLEAAGLTSYSSTRERGMRLKQTPQKRTL